MAIGQNGAVLRQINRLFESGTLVGLSESELLGRFVSRRDEAAFEALVTRHGPMVMGVCRRILFDSHDVDDAFQATFLILVKKAATLRDQTLLANWLYGVARHVSLKARAKAIRRRAFEGTGVETSMDVADRDRPEHPLKPILDEELARLSASDRAAIVLCDLQGYSGDEAALALGMKAVTFRSRLHRARTKLKGRLAQRGLVAGTLLETATLSFPPAQALADHTVKAAIAFAANPSAIGVVSASVVGLTREVLTSMMLTRMKTATALVMALGLVGTGMGVIAQEPSPSRDHRDNDRLQQVEQKLDRVLQALEGRRAPSPDLEGDAPDDLVLKSEDKPRRSRGPRSQREDQLDVRAEDNRTAPLLPPDAPPLEPRLSRRAIAPSADIRPSPAPGAPVADQRVSVKPPVEPTLPDDNFTGRLNRLERSLDSIEKRLRALEQASANPQPAALPAGTVILQPQAK